MWVGHVGGANFGHVVVQGSLTRGTAVYVAGLARALAAMGADAAARRFARSESLFVYQIRCTTHKPPHRPGTSA